MGVHPPHYRLAIVHSWPHCTHHNDHSASPLSEAAAVATAPVSPQQGHGRTEWSGDNISDRVGLFMVQRSVVAGVISGLYRRRSWLQEFHPAGMGVSLVGVSRGHIARQSSTRLWRVRRDCVASTQRDENGVETVVQPF
jgi:hypothetical protein